MKTKLLIKLAYDMVKTFDDLGNDGMARIDARKWAEYYRKKLNRLLKKPVSK